MRGGILDCRCARRSARRQVGTKGWSYSDRTKGWALELNSTALAYHVQFAELDAHNSVFVLEHRFSRLVAVQPEHRAGHAWSLWRHPPPELSGAARQLARLGARLS